MSKAPCRWSPGAPPEPLCAIPVRDDSRGPDHPRRRGSDPGFQPGSQPCELASHSKTPAANRATATPPRFTNQALRRARRKGEPTSMSHSKCRTPARTWCANAQTSTTTTALKVANWHSPVTCVKACSSRSERASKTGTPTARTTPFIRCPMELSAHTGHLDLRQLKENRSMRMNATFHPGRPKVGGR